MRKLYLKQEILSIVERFTVLDEKQKVEYSIEGSFFKIPKSFSIYDTKKREIAVIKKEIFSLLPKFTVEYHDKPAVRIEKELTIFKPRYKISADGVEVVGDWWDMNFEIHKNNQKIAMVNKRWLSWADTYEISILSPDVEELVVSIVVAIDCVKADEGAST